jgi:hypothetical protein
VFDKLGADLRAVLDQSMMLGLPIEFGIPATPEGPAVACRVQLSTSSGTDQATVLLSVSDSSGRGWNESGKFTLDLQDGAKPEKQAASLADRMAGGLLERLVHVTLVRQTKSKAREKQPFQIQIENASPLVLNGLSIVGSSEKDPTPPATLIGIALSPRKRLMVPASRESVERLHLGGGIHAYAANLSGL